MVDFFEGEDLTSFLVNVEDDFDDAWLFLSESGLEMTCLFDETGDLYRGYSTEAAEGPFPLEVVIDREGIITYTSRNYDAPEFRDAIQAALDAP